MSCLVVPNCTEEETFELGIETGGKNSLRSSKGKVKKKDHFEESGDNST